MPFVHLLGQVVEFTIFFDYTFRSCDDGIRSNTRPADVFHVPWVDLVLYPLVQVPGVDAAENISCLLELLGTMSVGYVNEDMTTHWLSGRLNAKLDVVGQKHITLWVFNLFGNLHVRLCCKDGINEHILDSFGYGLIEYIHACASFHYTPVLWL